ncbi:PR domain zinc finger protein 10-like [Elysia marginata]|uniref:PR domain zinc finger protein 10-like n=1 Tax=Elysia marginata TaxID=1093978 RepID=A0AAV4GI81_9GAST|nr:PR domain zinc finger protein 10-like [Elysia marginata]
MADSRQHLNRGGRHMGSVQPLSLSSSGLPSSLPASSVGTTSGRLAMDQLDGNNRSVMMPFSSGDLDLLQASNVQFSDGASSSILNTPNTSATSPAVAADISAGAAVFADGPTPSGYVLNGVVDESGNVLFEAVEPEINSQAQLFQSHNSHHHQQSVESSLHSSSTEMSSSTVMDPQGLGLLNLHSTISTNQSDSTASNNVSSNTNFSGISVQSTSAAGLIRALSAVNREMTNTQSDSSAQNIVSSNPNFPGISVQSSSAAGLIQALSAVNREISNSGSFPGLLPVSASQREGSEASMEVSSQGLVTFNPALPDDSASGTVNTAQVFLTQQQQQHQILNIMLEGSTSGSGGNIISDTPSVNLHHHRRVTVADTSSRVAGGEDNITSAGIGSGAEVMSSLGQSSSSVVTVTLDQQLLQQHEEEQPRQQQQNQQLWVQQSQADQRRLMSSQGDVSVDLTMGQLSSAVDSAAAVPSSQQGGQLSEVSGSFQPLAHHHGNNSDNNGFQDMHSQFSGIFAQQAHTAYQGAAPSSSSNIDPASPGEQPHPYAVIGGDSEAVPSNPGVSQQPRQHQEEHVVVDSQAVDSSCLQSEQFTLVFDAGSQTLRIQRMTSPSDCTVSQSILSMEGSEAQPSPAPAHYPSQAFSQAQANHAIPTTFTSGSSSQEVTTSTMPPQLRHMSDRAGSSGMSAIYNNGQQVDDSANSTSALASVMLKIEKSEGDGVPECDTTQEDIEGYEQESPAYVGTSNSTDDSQDGLHSTVLQPVLQRSEAISSMEVVMDTTLDSNSLTPLQAVTMETSREMIQATESLSTGTSAEDQDSQSVPLARSFLTDRGSTSTTHTKQAPQSVRKSRRLELVAQESKPQSVRKSRRLELVAQESKVSLKKRNYKSKQYDPALLSLDEADGRFACSECSRRFKTWAALQRHLTTHDEEDLGEEGEVRDDKMALLQEYASEEADGDADFVPGIRGDGARQIASVTTAQRRTKGASLRGRFRRGRGRMSGGEGSRRKTTFLAKTLKKYKRAQNQRPCSDGVLQSMKGMYRRRGKLSGGNEWMCTHCGLTFDNASLLNLHTLTHAAEDVGMDEIRKLAAPQAVESTADMSVGLMAVPPGSSPGSATTASGSNLQPLLPVSTNIGVSEGGAKTEQIVACPKCNMVFNDHKDLMDHVSTHAQKPQGKDGRRFGCDHCSKSFSTAEKLSKHQMVHGDESQKPLECPVCSKRIMTNSAMACHMKTHSDRKYFGCPICGTDFNTGAGLREHAHICHADQNGRFPCKECPKVFEDFALLKKHVRSFHSAKTFQCPECSKMFPRLDKLRLHMLRHTTHREFMCETCGRQFKRKDKLREHIKRLHGGGRDNLDHQLLAGGSAGEEQPAVTTTKFTPKVMPSEYHRFIYKCHTCLLGFKRRGMLVNHLAKRHPEIRLEQVPELNLPILKTQKDFYCQYCDKIYKSASKRKMHIQKMHPGCAIPPSSRKKLPSVGESGDVTAAAAAAGSSNGSVVNGFNNSSFSHTVSSITTMPHGCKFCHKQYASKAKLIQHQRKQHPEIAQPRSSSRRKIKKADPDMLQIAVGGEERYEPVLPITVVNQGADATDLLNLAMSELNYSGAGGVTSLTSLISSLGGGAAAAAAGPVAGAGGAMVGGEGMQDF